DTFSAEIHRDGMRRPAPFDAVPMMVCKNALFVQTERRLAKCKVITSKSVISRLEWICRTRKDRHQVVLDNLWPSHGRGHGGETDAESGIFPLTYAKEWSYAVPSGQKGILDAYSTGGACGLPQARGLSHAFSVEESIRLGSPDVKSP